MAQLRIYVPCAVLRVRVQLGYGSGGLSPMEAALLRMVIGLSVLRGGHAERPEPVPLRDLIALVGLGRGMTTHLVVDLWRQGHLVLDMRNELVTPDTEVVQAHRAGTLGGLATGESAFDLVEVLQECVTGQALGLMGHTTPPDPRLALPRHSMFAPTNDDISATELLQAAATVVSRSTEDPSDTRDPATAGRGRRPTVRGAHLDRTGSALPATRWIPLEVTARHDADTRRLRVTVTDRLLDAGRRTTAGERISQYLEQAPDTEFVRHLRGQVGFAYAPPPTLDRNFEKLGRLLTGTEAAAAGTRQSHHARLTYMAEEVRRQLEERRASEMQVRVIGTGARYRDEVRTMVARAERQLVFASPTVSSARLESLLDPLEEAVSRGVQLVVLWGSRHERTLDSRAHRMLQHLGDLAKRTAGARAVLYAMRPARSAACLVVVDAREALVSGCAPLGDTSYSGELGLAVTATDQAVCGPVERLLTWARRAMPDYAVSRGILFRPSELTKPHAPGPFLPAEPLPIEVPAYPADPPEDDRPEDVATVRAWFDAWSEVVDGLRRAADDVTGTAVAVVEDAAHRDQLWDRLREAQSRIVVGADQLVGQVVDARLVEVLRTRLDTGVHLRVVHRRGKPDAHGRDGHALLRGLQVGRPAESCRVDRAQNNGRALVCDDTAVVGSFDFLAHEGYFSSTGQRPDAELGLVVHDRGVADAVAAALGSVAFAEDAPATTPPAPRPAALGSGTQDSAAALRLLTDLEPLDQIDRRALRIRTAVEHSGAALLAALDSAEAPDDVLRVGAAWLMLGAFDSGGPEAARWASWLLREAWRRGDVAGCWVLRGAVDAAGWGPVVDASTGAEGGGPPDEAYIRLAAALGGTRVGELVQSVALTDGSTPAQLATVALVAATELVTGPDEALHQKTLRETLDYLTVLPSVGAPWSELARLVADTDPELFPFPLEGVRDHDDVQRRRAEFDAAWQGVADALAAVTSTSFMFDVGIKTHAHLFHTAGPFGVLADLCERRDAVGLRAWIQSPDLKDPATLVDSVSDEVTQSRSRIEGRPRRGYVMKLSAVLRAARRLARLPDPPDNRLVARAAVPVAVAAMASPDRQICDAMLGRLAPVVEWGRSVDG